MLCKSWRERELVGALRFRTATPKANPKTLSSCLVYDFRASCITV